MDISNKILRLSNAKIKAYEIEKKDIVLDKSYNLVLFYSDIIRVPFNFKDRSSFKEELNFLHMNPASIGYFWEEIKAEKMCPDNPPCRS